VTGRNIRPFISFFTIRASPRCQGGDEPWQKLRGPGQAKACAQNLLFPLSNLIGRFQNVTRSAAAAASDACDQPRRDWKQQQQQHYRSQKVSSLTGRCQLLVDVHGVRARLQLLHGHHHVLTHRVLCQGRWRGAALPRQDERAVAVAVRVDVTRNAAASRAFRNRVEPGGALTQTASLGLRLVSPIWTKDLSDDQGCSSSKRGLGTAFPHQIKRETASNSSNEVSIRLRIISTLDLPVHCSAMVLYTRSFIHLCCSRRYM